ncbi:MAG: serine/threonine-protein kinase, partial [Planctomycetota bacterium]
MLKPPDMNQDNFLERLNAVDGDDERAALIDSLCGDDTLARQQLQAIMQRSLSGQRDDLPTKPPGTGSTIVSQPNLVGEWLGHYEILEPLGEGGMGVVYLAQQEQPVKRRVAVKVTKPGFESPQLLARFQAERQALALMDHEHIAKVFDAGSTPDGRLYFVMELVDGVPITRYCEQRQLSMAARLDLFLLVCRAIQHAHQKGVVHRDVKPSNVLIVEVDGRPLPKVIDFGLAKALEQPLAPHTLQTQYGQVLGTLEYMSPEQASFASVDVDTRADVFALGVLLYELLTGTTPLGRTRLEQLELDQVFHVIREEEPVRPSIRLASLRDDQARPVPWDTVPSDLDWITLKALEKDRERRYDSPAALAADVERFGEDEPIDARCETRLDELDRARHVV